MRQFTSPVLFVAALCSTIVQSAFAGDGAKFERIAPKNSVLVLWAKDLGEFAARAEATGIGQIFNAPELASVTGPIREEARKQREADLQKLGVDGSEVPWPAGAGLSILVEHDEELDAPAIGLLIWADYGSRSETAAKLADGVIKEMEKDLGKSFEEVEIQGGRKATRIEFPDEDQPNNPQSPQPPRRRRPGGLDALGELAAVPESVYYAHVDSQFFLASSVPVLEEAIAAATGQASPSIADSDDWRGVNALCGEQDLGAVLMIEPLKVLLAPVFVGPMASTKSIAGGFFGDVRSIALFAKGDTDSSLISAGAAAYIPGPKVGLMDLVSASTPVEPPPAMLGDNALSYYRINVKFDQIMKMVEGIVDSLSGPEADAIAPMLAQFGPGLSKTFSAMGPQVWSVTQAPLGDATEGRGVTAIKCSDEKVANAVLATLLPSAGLMPRDFRGQVVYGSEFSPMEVGIGGGAMLLGTSEAVEQALRSSSDPAAVPLSEGALFKQCAASLQVGAVSGWGFADMPAILDRSRKDFIAFGSGELPDDLVAGEGEGDSAFDNMMPMQVDPKMVGALDTVDHALLTRYLGPLVWDLRSEDKGLVYRANWLRPTAASK